MHCMPNVGLRAKPVRVQARNYIVTLNNPRLGLSDYEREFKKGAVEYTVQIEKGDSETNHLQAFIRFSMAVDWKRAQSLFGNEKAHIERCRNPGQSEEYCRKAESRREGPITSMDPATFSGGQRQRADIKEVAAAGASMASIAQKWPETYIKFHRGNYYIGGRHGRSV